MHYHDEKGNAVFVSNGLDPRFFMTFRKKPGGAGMHRVKSKNLPERRTRAAAQRDLDAYAAGKGWKPVAAMLDGETLNAGNGLLCRWRRDRFFIFNPRSYLPRELDPVLRQFAGLYRMPEGDADDSEPEEKDCADTRR